MKKTFENISAVSQMTGKAIPEGWQCFQGNTTEFRYLSKHLDEVGVGIDGYLNTSDELYKGDMKKTFVNISAVAQMRGKTIPEGWQCFQGNTTEFRDLEEYLGEVGVGIDGYRTAADKLYKGDMEKTFKNISAVAKMRGKTIPEGWQCFHGNTKSFETQRLWLQSHKKATVEEFIKEFKYRSDKTAKAHFSSLKKVTGAY